MKHIWILILMFIALQGRADVVNSIVANVGQYSISKLDIQKMSEFLQISKSTNNAMIELIMAYSVFTSIENDDQIVFRDNEVDSIVKTLTNTNNTSDSMAKARQQLYHDYPDEYKLELKKNQIIRSLAYYKPDIKSSVDETISEKDMTNFYLKNKKYFINAPLLDMYIISVPQPADVTLDKLDEIEQALAVLTNALKKSDDVTPLLEKYKNLLKPEPYSGRTGFKPINEIYNAGCPEELINIALMQSIPMRSAPPLIVKNGTIIGYEKYLFKNSPNKIHYFIIKLINRKSETQSSFEDSRAAIENILKEDKLRTAIQKFIINKINHGEITVNIIDKSYEGVYDEFLRR